MCYGTGNCDACLNFHWQSSAPMLYSFPRLSAGPIDRAERFAQDLRKDFRLTQDETLSAGQRIAIGLFKKFVIADALALIALNDALAITGPHYRLDVDHRVRLCLPDLFRLQRLYRYRYWNRGRLVGIKLPENFAAPYLKPNLTQFWNSWHMTSDPVDPLVLFQSVQPLVARLQVHPCLDDDPDRSARHDADHRSCGMV